MEKLNAIIDRIGCCSEVWFTLLFYGFIFLSHFVHRVVSCLFLFCASSHIGLFRFSLNVFFFSTAVRYVYAYESITMIDNYRYESFDPISYINLNDIHILEYNVSIEAWKKICRFEMNIVVFWSAFAWVGLCLKQFFFLFSFCNKRKRFANANRFKEVSINLAGKINSSSMYQRIVVKSIHTVRLKKQMPRFDWWYFRRNGLYK